jgi:hypothetical protein
MLETEFQSAKLSDNIENIEIEKEVEEVEVIQPKKKQLSLKQLEHLNNIRVKALEKKREIKLKKNKEYENKVTKTEIIEEPIIKATPDPVIKRPTDAHTASGGCPDVKPDVKKKKVNKKVIKYVEQDSDDDDEEQEEEIIVTKKKGKNRPEIIPPPVQQVEKSYNDLLCESSLERMQSKIMNERAKHLITHIIPNYY